MRRNRGRRSRDSHLAATTRAEREGSRKFEQAVQISLGARHGLEGPRSCPSRPNPDAYGCRPALVRAVVMEREQALHLATTSAATRNIAPGYLFGANPGGPRRRAPTVGGSKTASCSPAWRAGGGGAGVQALEDFYRRAFEDCALIFSSP